MKKTISSSIGGIVFNVEEDAHDKLSAYIDAISASLKDSEGHDEIMSDIESRIAEILQQKVDSYKQVITLTEVDEVIGIMGDPEDFGAPTGSTKQQSYSSSDNQYGYSGRRRVYRDTDDKVILGVCSGLSHHFGVDPIWLRLVFGLSIFIGGFGVILYFLLAVITPKARTAAEKLEMMGEPVDVNNIRKKMEEEMDSFKKKVKDFGNDFKSGRTGDRAKDFGRDMGDFFSSSGRGLGNAVGSVFKTILTIISIFIAFIFTMLLVAFIVSLTSGVNVIHIESGNHHMMHYSVRNFLDMLSVTGGMRTILLTGIFLFLGIPLLSVIVRFIRAAAGRRQPYQWFTITAGILWSVAWVLMIIGISSVYSHFSVNDFKRSNVIVTPQPNKTLYVKMDNRRVGEDIIELDSLNVYVSDEDEFRGNPSLCIEQSPDSNYHLVLTKIARGINKAEADDYADAIDYSYVSHDSSLTLDPYFSLDMNKGWRKQKLDISLQVPINKSVDLPEGIDHIICPALHHKGQHIGGEKWTMTQGGLMPYTK
jgi:phage shock protein PspC (stress-responsive transcriptional regulator)